MSHQRLATTLKTEALAHLQGIQRDLLSRPDCICQQQLAGELLWPCVSHDAPQGCPASRPHALAVPLAASQATGVKAPHQPVGGRPHPGQPPAGGKLPPGPLQPPRSAAAALPAWRAPPPCTCGPAPPPETWAFTFKPRLVTLAQMCLVDLSGVPSKRRVEPCPFVWTMSQEWCTAGSGWRDGCDMM